MVVVVMAYSPQSQFLQFYCDYVGILLVVLIVPNITVHHVVTEGWCHKSNIIFFDYNVLYKYVTLLYNITNMKTVVM